MCPLYNLKTVKDFSMKLGTHVDSQVSDRFPWATCIMLCSMNNVTLSAVKLEKTSFFFFFLAT